MRERGRVRKRAVGGWGEGGEGGKGKGWGREG